MIAYFIQDLNNWVVDFPTGDYELVRDGKTEKFKASGKIDIGEFDSEPEVYRLAEISFLSHYVSRDGTEMAVEDYLTKRKELESKGVFDGDEWEFDNVDDEFNYFSFIKTHTQVLKHGIQKEKVELVKRLVAVNSGNPFIKTWFSVGKDSELVYFFKVSAAISVAKEHLKKLGYGDGAKEVDFPTHGGIRFVKIAGKYVFTDEWNYPEKETTTLEEALKRYTDLQKQIQTKLEVADKLAYGVVDSAQVLTAVYGKIKSLNSLVGKLDVKVKSNSDYLALKREINSIQQSIDKAINGSETKNE